MKTVFSALRGYFLDEFLRVFFVEGYVAPGGLGQDDALVLHVVDLHPNSSKNLIFEVLRFEYM